MLHSDVSYPAQGLRPVRAAAAAEGTLQAVSAPEPVRLEPVRAQAERKKLAVKPPLPARLCLRAPRCLREVLM